MIDNLIGKVQRIRDQYNLQISVKFRRGKPFLLEPKTGKIISPILNQKEMFFWLDAFEIGIIVGRG